MNKVFNLSGSEACSSANSSFIMSVAKPKLVTVAVALALLQMSNVSFAQECAVGTNGTYRPSGAGCTITPSSNPKYDPVSGVINLESNANYLLMNANNRDSTTRIAEGHDLKVKVDSENQYGFTVAANQHRANKELILGNVEAEYKAKDKGYGLETTSTNNITAKDVTLDATLKDSGSEIYGLLAGSSVDSGEKDPAHNGKYATISVDNLNIKQSSGSGKKLTPALNAGLRSIQGATDDTNGSAGRIIVNGDLDMTLEGQRMEGIYVSGAASDEDGNEAVSQVVLKGDSKITLIQTNSANNESSAIKIGKSRAVGTGKGAVYSEGNMTIDASQAIGDAIKLYGSGSLLQADYEGSTMQVKANRSAIAVGPKDWQEPGNQAYSDIAVYLKDAKLETVSEDASLIKVYDNQKDFTLSIVGDETELIAPDKGWLLEVGVGSNNIVYEGNTNATFSGAGTMRGLTHINGSQLNLTLNDGFTWNLQKKGTDNQASFTTLHLNNNSLLNAFDSSGPTDFTLRGDVFSSDSTISMSNGIIGDELIIQGSYRGDNARLLVDSRWDNPDEQQTDHLSIFGIASGNTVVSVPNGIIGDVTLGELPKNGQWVTPVVSVFESDEQKPNTFTGTAETTNAGQAQLVQRDDENGGSHYYWTLAAQAPTPEPGPTPEPTPIYTPGTSGYVQMSRINREMGFAQMGKLHERIGEQQTWVWDECGTQCEDYRDRTQAGNKPYPVWGRINYTNLKEQGQNRFGYESDIAFIQFGGDLLVRTDEDNNHHHLGIMASYSHGEHDFYDKYRAENGLVTEEKQVGSGKTDMYSLGAYSTWYGDNGSYVDLVANVSSIRNKYKSTSGHDSQNGWGVGVSAEVGRPWLIGNSNWQIEPQAQLSYQYVHLSSFDDDVRNISDQSGGTLRGRVGARLAYNQDNGDLRTNTFYVTANVLHDFAGNKSEAKIGRDKVREEYKRTWGELGVGAQLPIGKSTYLYGDVRYARAFGGDNKVYRSTDAARESIAGRVGVRFSW